MKKNLFFGQIISELMAVKSGDQSWLDEQKLKGLYTSLVTTLNLPLTLEARCDFLYRYAVSY